MNIFVIERVGVGAGEALDGLSRAGGAVVVTFTHAAHLRAANGRLLALQAPGLALSPWSARLVTSPSSWPRVGSPVGARGDTLAVGALRFRLPPSALHATEPDTGDSRSKRPSPVTGHPQVLRSLARAAEESAFGPWWRPIARDSEEPWKWVAAGQCRTGASPIRAPGSWVRDAGERQIRRLVTSVRRADGAEAVAAATALLGLGPGLTPAGDDILIGFFAAWQRLQLPDLDSELRRALLALLVAQAPSFTTPTSAEFLYHLAAGRMSGPLDELLTALSFGTPHEVELAASIVADEGHTSGRDCLSGVLALLLASGLDG